MTNNEICRFCLSVIDSSVHPIFKNGFEEIIELLVSVKISEDDGLPQNMCCHCQSQLLSVKCFQEKALDSTAKLTWMLKRDGNLDGIFREALQDRAVIHCDAPDSSVWVKAENNAPKPDFVQESENQMSDSENAVNLENATRKSYKKFHCKLCKLGFKTSKNLASHKRTKHVKSSVGTKLNDLPKCYSPNSPKVEDIFYKKSSARPFLYHCTMCNIDIKGERELKRHKNKHCRVKCEICEIYVRNDHLKKHMENIHSHKNITEPAISDNENIELHTEDDSKCINVFIKKNVIKMSRKKQCTNATEKLKKSKVYNKSEGIIVVLNDTIPYKYHCNICDVDFTGQKLVNYHKNKHFKKVCKFCGVSVTYGNYSNHLRNHVAGKQVCDVCGAVLASFESLRSHIFMLHNDSKKLYDCEECNVTFRYKKYLTQHSMKVHTGFRPHVCDTCGKRFFALRLLKKHINTVHLKLRNNICEYCKKGFSSRYALKVHTRQHTNETPYVCGLCAEGFRQPVSLRTHMKSKHGIDVTKNKDGDQLS